MKLINLNKTYFRRSLFSKRIVLSESDFFLDEEEGLDMQSVHSEVLGSSKKTNALAIPVVIHIRKSNIRNLFIFQPIEVLQMYILKIFRKSPKRAIDL